MATSLSSSSYTAPQYLVKSIFYLRIRGFCSHHHLDRQVSSAGEAMEHGPSRTLQSHAMRRKGVTTHQQEAPSLPLCCSEATDCCSLNYYLLHYRSAQQLIGKIVERNFPCCLLAYHSFPFSGVSGSDSHMTHLLSAASRFPQEGTQNVWLLQLPSPGLPLVLLTCTSSSHLEQVYTPIQTHSNYQKF